MSRNIARAIIAGEEHQTVPTVRNDEDRGTKRAERAAYLSTDLENALGQSLPAAGRVSRCPRALQDGKWMNLCRPAVTEIRMRM